MALKRACVIAVNSCYYLSTLVALEYHLRVSRAALRAAPSIRLSENSMQFY
jgi:hypothetical protein